MWRRQHSQDLVEVLAERISPVEGDLIEDLVDAMLDQDLRWLEDQQAGRESVT